MAGGTGSRLHPLTKVTNKHLLPVFNKPMIYFPLFKMKEAGIREVMIVSGKGHAGDFLELLGSGSQFGMKISYEVQDEPGGIAQALGLAQDFVRGDKFLVILGDNVIEDDLSQAVDHFEGQPAGAKIFLKEVPNPRSYGVAEVHGDRIESIEEKPHDPKSNFAVVGLYMYDSEVFDVIEQIKPSGRGELEITDVNNAFIERGSLSYSVLKGFWGDCGESFESLLDASVLVSKSDLAKIFE